MPKAKEDLTKWSGSWFSIASSEGPDISQGSLEHRGEVIAVGGFVPPGRKSPLIKDLKGLVWVQDACISQ